MSGEYLALARRIPFFNGLSSEEIAKIFSKGLTMRVEKGNTVFYKGTTGNAMFVVLGGKVSLFDGEKHIADLSTGDMFGEMALISKAPRSATAVAAEESNLFVLNESVFERLMTKRAAIRILLNIVGTLSERLRIANMRLVELDQERI
jgi:CRP-like cAMP-binding protein